MVLFAPAPVGAQITFDSVSSGLTSLGISASWMHTVGTGAKRILVVGLESATTFPYPTATSVIYGGQPLTRQVVSTPFPNVEIWTLLAPPSGTAMIVATFPQNNTDIIGGSVSFFGVDPGTPIRASNTVTTFVPTNGTISTSVISEIGDVVINAVGGSDASPVEGNPAMGQTLRWKNTITEGLGGSTTVKRNQIDM